MAHANFHIAVGMGLGVASTLPFVVADWARNRPLAAPIRRLLIATYALGVFAIGPGLLRRLGAPDAIVEGPWMNLFVFHPTLNRLTDSGMLVGELFIGACFVGQYLLILLALAHAHRARKRQRDT